MQMPSMPRRAIVLNQTAVVRPRIFTGFAP